MFNAKGGCLVFKNKFKICRIYHSVVDATARYILYALPITVLQLEVKMKPN